MSRKRSRQRQRAAPPADAKVSERAIRHHRLRESIGALSRIKEATLKPYKPVDGVIPKNQPVVVMDYAPLRQSSPDVRIDASLIFPGYPYLAQLALKAEFRKIVSTLAEEMVRGWIKVTYATDDEDASDKLQRIEARLDECQAKEVFRQALSNDLYFGRGTVYIDTKLPGSNLAASEKPGEMRTPLTRDAAKIPKGAFLGLRSIEPVWTYPSNVNTTRPLASNYFNPDAWYVMGEEVHKSRLINLVSEPVPDLMRPAYAWGGMPLTMIMEAYVNNWICVRDSVKDLIKSYSISGLKTNMEDLLQLENHSPDDIVNRAELFNALRDNRSLFMLDKEEEFFQFNTPLSGLGELLTKTQEQLPAMSSIPIVKLLGNTPSGLNASSDGEIRVFYDWIEARREALLREPINRIIDIIQLSEFDEIDPNINFEFESLYQLSDKERAEMDLQVAQTDAAYVTANILSDIEVREKIHADKNSPYRHINPDDTPEDDHDYPTPPEEEGNAASGDKAAERD